MIGLTGCCTQKKTLNCIWIWNVKRILYETMLNKRNPDKLIQSLSFMNLNWTKHIRYIVCAKFVFLRLLNSKTLGKHSDLTGHKGKHSLHLKLHSRFIYCHILSVHLHYAVVHKLPWSKCHFKFNFASLLSFEL